MPKHPKNIPLYHLPHTSRLGVPLIIGQLDPQEFAAGGSTPDRHSFYTIFWFLSGEGVHHIDYEPYPIQQDSLFLMQPGQTHFFEMRSAPTGYKLFFDESFLDGQLSRITAELFRLAVHRPVYNLSSSECEKLHPYFSLIQREFKQHEPHQHMILQQLLTIILLQIHPLFQSKNGRQPQTLTGDFQKMVEEHFHEFHRLAPYAGQLGVTRDYLSECVKRDLGFPASILIRRRLLAEAKRLLAHSHLTAAEISRALGFVDRAYFNRFFKREAGLTPINFRKTFREKYNIGR